VTGGVVLAWSSSNPLIVLDGRVQRSCGEVRTARFEPLLVRHRGSLPYLHARPVDAESDDDEELIRTGYVEAMPVIG
jgi:hypothetical protein